MRNKIVTYYNPRGRKAGWYIAYSPSQYERICEVFRTKREALIAARKANSFQNIVDVDFLWGRYPLREEIGRHCKIIDRRKD